MQIIQTSYNFISDAPFENCILKSCTAIFDTRVFCASNEDDDNAAFTENYDDDRTFNASALIIN